MMTIDGDVVAVHSFWADDRSRIVTEATVRTPDGDVVVMQAGGSVDDIATIQLPGPPLLEPGMKVAIAAHRAADLAQREHIVLDSVKVLDYPPGFVRSTSTVTGKQLYWESGCIFVTIDSAGTTAIPGDDEFPVIQAAIDTWNNDTASCSYLQVKSEGRKPGLEVSDKDTINLIKFRDTGCASCLGTSWCQPAAGNVPENCLPPAAAALAHVSYVKMGEREGEIVDVDIEVNGVEFAIAVNGRTASTQPCHADLQNTLTHELGHLHGLEHTCRASGDPARKDNQGRDVPFCALTTDPAIVEATMYNFQDCGETKKASLSDDDISAICQAYAKAEDPGACLHVGEAAGCCSASGRPDVSLLLAGTTVLIMMRRRKTSPDA